MRFAIASVQKSTLVDKAGVYLTGPLIEQFESAALNKDIQAWVICTAGDQRLKTFTFICLQTPEMMLQFIPGKSGPEAHHSVKSIVVSCNCGYYNM